PRTPAPTARCRGIGAGRTDRRCPRRRRPRRRRPGRERRPMGSRGSQCLPFDGDRFSAATLGPRGRPEQVCFPLTGTPRRIDHLPVIGTIRSAGPGTGPTVVGNSRWYQEETVVDWNDEVDVLVAGSGGGLAGAYTAAREGLGVAVVEATDKFGGTTAYSGGGGMWFPCNPVLRRAGTDDTIEDALTYYHAVVGDRTPRELQETYVRRGGDLIEY